MSVVQLKNATTVLKMNDKFKESCCYSSKIFLNGVCYCYPPLFSPSLFYISPAL